MSKENIALAERWFDEVWNNGRAEAVDEMFATDGIAHGLGAGGDLYGPAEFKPFVEKFRGAFPNINITVEDAIAEGDKVALRWTARMKHEGDHLGFAATQKDAVIAGMSIVRVRDGQIVEGWNNWDQLGLMQQLGVV